jgi:CBS domain containing-hemolysin-like protein
LAERELSWFERISNLSDKKAEDFAILRENLDILHEKDLLTPLVIDELFKSKREVFVVMDEADAEVLGVVKMSKIGEISADSKRVRTVMEREFFEVRSDKNALEVFEKMTKRGESFAILTDRSGVFVGILFVKEVLR